MLAWHSTSSIELILILGIGVAILGMLVGCEGHRRLILAIVPACVATVVFWVTATYP
jgi:hypothetical protein